MEEKRLIDEQEKEIDMMWHEVLLTDVRAKELQERRNAEQRRNEMLERRRAYNDQIASANLKRREILREQREQENRRIEKMKKKMELDYHEALKRKKDQQVINKANYIEGHILKMESLRNDKEKERQVDNRNIQVALEELRKERERKRLETLSFKKEQDLLIRTREHEQQFLSELEAKSDKITQQWKHQEEKICDRLNKDLQEQRNASKKKALQEYKEHLENKNTKALVEKQELSTRMRAVKRTAVNEIQININKAYEELSKQIDYRNCLIQQIQDNQQFMEQEIQEIANKDRPFIKRPQMFKDIMNSRFPVSQSRDSTNPVHPFKRLMDQKDTTVQLPEIGRCYSNNNAIKL